MLCPTYCNLSVGLTLFVVEDSGITSLQVRRLWHTSSSADHTHQGVFVTDDGRAWIDRGIWALFGLRCGRLGCVTCRGHK